MHNAVIKASDLKELIDYLRLEYKPEKVILFGSYGTDKYESFSDIDLLIVKETEKRSRKYGRKQKDPFYKNIFKKKPHRRKKSRRRRR